MTLQNIKKLFRKKTEEEKEAIRAKKNEPKYESEISRFFFYRSKDKKEYKERRIQHGNAVVPFVVEGLGGLKNIISIKGKGLAVVVKFRSKYRLKEDILKKAGGLHLWIGDGELIEIFDYLEVKTIVAAIQAQVKNERARLIKIEVA